ncbi:MAG TPA: aldo/keto reductase [bacterium]|nr:aldo/keto reductase [bacterium]HQL61085.1 aldo/keto reductase [bacterium]
MFDGAHTRRTFLKGATAFGGSVAFGGLSLPTWGDTAPIPSRLLGKTGMSVPVFGIGTASLGYHISPVESQRIIQRALDLGATFLDTAYAYGHAQKDIGQVVKHRRCEAIIATKVHTSDGTTARLQLEESLRLLGTEYVDLLYIHSAGMMDPERTLGPGGALEALLAAKKNGVTRAIGFTAHHCSDVLFDILETDSMDAVMVPVNDPEFQVRFLPAAERAGVGIIGIKVFGGAKAVPYAKHTGCGLCSDKMDSALRTGFLSPSVASIVVGIGNSEELLDNVKRVGRVFYSCII